MTGATVLFFAVPYFLGWVSLAFMPGRRSLLLGIMIWAILIWLAGTTSLVEIGDGPLGILVVGIVAFFLAGLIGGAISSVFVLACGKASRDWYYRIPCGLVFFALLLWRPYRDFLSVLLHPHGLIP